MGLLCCVLFVFSNARRQLVIRPRQIRTDLFPVVATIACLPKRVSGEEEQMRIERRKDNRLGPQHSEVFCLHRHRKYILRLTGAAIESRQLTADDNVWIERIGNDVTIFLSRDRLPIAEGDLAFIAEAFDSDRPAFLLSAVKPVRKRVVSANVIQLRSRLVYHELQLLPPFTVTIAPWTEPRRMMSGLLGLIQTF